MRSVAPDFRRQPCSDLGRFCHVQTPRKQCRCFGAAVAPHQSPFAFFRVARALRVGRLPRAAGRIASWAPSTNSRTCFGEAFANSASQARSRLSARTRTCGFSTISSSPAAQNRVTQWPCILASSYSSLRGSSTWKLICGLRFTIARPSARITMISRRGHYRLDFPRCPLYSSTSLSMQAPPARYGEPMSVFPPPQRSRPVTVTPGNGRRLRRRAGRAPRPTLSRSR